MVVKEKFIELLRDSLSHLYDADRLRQSPLAALFDVANRVDAASALRDVLIEGVESLRPEEDTPAQSRDWRLYEALFYTYVQQLDQRIVADQLALSVRHLRREQRVALELLADRLQERLDRNVEPPDEADDVSYPAQGAPISTKVSEELGWLKNLPSEEPIDLEQKLAEVMELTGLLAAQRDIHIEITTEGTLADLAVHPVALKQILLNLLSVAVNNQLPDSRVDISVRPLGWEIEVRIQGTKPSHKPQSFSADDVASLEMACQLATLCGGRLTPPTGDEEIFGTTLVLPTLEQLPVLVIDDNADTLQLLQRYTAGTRYHLIGTQDPEQVLALTTKHAPQIIILDVMMPRVDGWKLMGTLRQHPLTSHIPIVVCTILTQEKLALSLGASGFIQKPVKRQTLLDTLNHQVELIEPARGPH